MIVYTTFEIVELIFDADCKDDINCICDYINEFKRKYSLNSLQGFQDIINNKTSELLN